MQNTRPKIEDTRGGKWNCEFIDHQEVCIEQALKAYEQVCMQARQKILQEQQEKRDAKREANLKRQIASAACIWVGDLVGEKRKVEDEEQRREQRESQRSG